MWEWLSVGVLTALLVLVFQRSISQSPILDDYQQTADVQRLNE